MHDPLDAAHLPPGVRARLLRHVNGLDMHLLEAGEAGRPLLLLLHGFPELAFSWRHVMVPLAEAGYHVVAPDQRGYGRTTGWTASFDGEIQSFGPLNYVRDALALVAALGHTEVASVIGHDFGSPVAGNCAISRPDVFRSVALMSAPYGGPRPWPRGEQPQPEAAAGLASGGMNEALGRLDPPRKHYQWYYSTREANENMWHARQGLANFIRAYYHHKSADWAANTPFRLSAWTASELARMPTYYIMPAGLGMAETVAAEMPGAAEVAANGWLPEKDLAVYAMEYGRTGFQGGLQSYRCTTSGLAAAEMRLFAGRRIEVPSCYIAGASDWGVYQKPGDFEAMQATACADLRGAHLVPGAGHWVQQEQPEATVGLLLDFLRGQGAPRRRDGRSD
ncbi:alpha/beta fold hydrolase [Roseococcus sp. SYP-B2431]|uniref:alpha/beta hydrolase n=1 Tax=Roseococcus sp. SYP-B2431 TaxID=2496640 RepID=UPI001038A5EC|nr:alpha/beta hydrolase [Roseococcus sp. SYP-B2431]TCH97536.1 alpha/beta fold hydrolase [Roseococcus sp. SYP-B2431]